MYYYYVHFRRYLFRIYVKKVYDISQVSVAIIYLHNYEKKEILLPTQNIMLFDQSNDLCVFHMRVSVLNEDNTYIKKSAVFIWLMISTGIFCQITYFTCIYPGILPNYLILHV